MKKKSDWTDSNRKKLVLESHINLHGLDYIDDRKCWMNYVIKECESPRSTDAIIALIKKKVYKNLMYGYDSVSTLLP